MVTTVLFLSLIKAMQKCLLLSGLLIYLKYWRERKETNLENRKYNLFNMI